MPRPVRRVVTGHTPDGKATIVFDGPAPQVNQGADPEGGSTVLWVTDRAPASNAGNQDAAPAGIQNPVSPPWPGGSIFRIVDFVPRGRATGPATALRGVHDTEERTRRHPG